MVGNAAGPIMSIYFLSMGFEKINSSVPQLGFSFCQCR